MFDLQTEVSRANFRIVRFGNFHICFLFVYSRYPAEHGKECKQ